MDPMIVFLIILIVVIIAAIGWYVMRRKRMASDPAYAERINARRAAREQERQRKRVEKAELKAKKARYNEMIAPEKSAYQQARQEYNGRVDRAEDALKKLNKDHDRAIRDQEKALNEIEKRYTAQLASVGGVKLYVDRLATREFTVAMNGTLHAETATGEELLANADARPEFRFVEAVEGETKPTSSGTIVGGLGHSETPLDIYVAREMSYLFVHGTAAEHGSEPINICMPVRESKADEAAQLRDALNDAAGRAEQTQADKAREIDEAATRLEQIREDTAAIEEAAAEVERQRADRTALDDALALLNEAEARAQEELDYHPAK